MFVNHFFVLSHLTNLLFEARYVFFLVIPPSTKAIVAMTRFKKLYLSRHVVFDELKFLSLLTIAHTETTPTAPLHFHPPSALTFLAVRALSSTVQEITSSSTSSLTSLPANLPFTPT